MPNEVAPAHRHTAFAMRFIIEGNGGFTAIHGRRITMQRGDVILTPSWNWHDHGKDGSGPMIWLDQLNLPVFELFPVHFVERYEDARYPAENIDSDSSPLVFAWKRMQKKLDSVKGDWVRERYLKTNGEECRLPRLPKASMLLFVLRTTTDLGKKVSRSLGGSAERLNKGATSPATRETSSNVYHVYSGKGQTVINDQTFTWKQGDTFCIPSWHRYQHFAGDDQNVYLYRCDDQPMVKALGLYRTEHMDVESLVSE